jgi:hypothetical protein
MLLALLAALWIVIATAVMAGYLAGITLAASRPAQLADLGAGHPRRTTERVSPLPSPDVARLAEAPDWSPGVSRPVKGPGRITPLPAVAGSSPQPTSSPRTAKPSAALMAPAAVAQPGRSRVPAGTVAGVATWFDSPSGVSAAGPALRAALGPGWRGQTVTVCAGDRCVETVLGDWCACGDRPGGPTVIDLHAPVFAALAPLSRGVIRVVIP